MDSSFDSTSFASILYGSKDEITKFHTIKKLKQSNETFKFRPEAYCNEPNENLADEGKALLEFIKLHRSKALDLPSHLPYLSDLTHFSRTPEIHFNLFRNLCASFSSEKNAKLLTGLVQDFSLVGSVLYNEFNFDTNVVSDNVEATVALCPHSKNFYLSTPANKAKLCQYYTPHSNHVIIFARVVRGNAKSAPLPFLVQLRDPNTHEYKKGVKLNWLGPSFGGISGREYAFSFDNFSLGTTLALDKFVTVENGNITLLGDDATYDYVRRVNFLRQQVFDLRKSAKEALKASFLVVRYSKNRTQFKTMEEKGKERPIFEYNYNKTRIMKALLESITLCLATSELEKNILSTSPQSFDKFNELFVFTDALEVFVHEKCLLAVETLRESIGGLGFLKFSGIPNLQENALKNAVNSVPSKNLRYLSLGEYVSRLNFDKKTALLNDYGVGLTERDEANVYSKVQDFQNNSQFLTWFLGRRLALSKKKIVESRIFNEPVGKLLNTLTNFDDVQKLGDSFIVYVLQSSAAKLAGKSSFVRTVLDSVIISTLLDDVSHLLREQKSVLPENSTGTLRDRLDGIYNNLGKIGVEIIESFGFDEHILHSCISKTADETYEKMLNMSKNHNPRNDEKVQKEIREGLIKFLNRPGAKL